MCIRDSYKSGLYAKNYLILFEFAAVIVCHRKKIYRHTHTDTVRKTTFFHVLSVVESESAIISNTIFFAITILPFLKEYGSKISVWRTIHDFHILRFIFKIIFIQTAREGILTKNVLLVTINSFLHYCI